MTNYTHILMFSIGPVQSFIAEARRTIDLYAGSQMLAQVAHAAAQSLAQSGGLLIYPILNEQGNNTPNVLMALVNNPVETANSAKTKALEKWQAFADTALKNLADTTDAEFQEIWRRQLKHHLEFYWAAAPYNPEQYPASYKKVSAAHAARKRSRLFEAIEEDGLKDSLSGSRSALRTGREKNKEKAARDYWQGVQANATSAELQPGELLDTIGAMKRFGVTGQFPSTSTVAVTCFVKSCNRHHLAELIEKIKAINEKIKNLPPDINFENEEDRQAANRFFVKKENYLRPIKNFADQNFPYGGDLLYAEGWARNRLAENYGELPDQLYDQITPEIEAAKEILTQLHQETEFPLTPYYAILQMDGDNMGKHVSVCQTLEDHQKLSQTLAQFTEKAKEIVEAKNGYLVYAGGDDVLAFFPAATALDAADALTTAYRRKFEDWQQTDRHNNPFPFTASAGIAFAHYLHPLEAVLQATRRAEKQAKKTYGRNALCISILRRSGETLNVGGKWQIEGSEANLHTVEMVNRLKKLLEGEQMSSRFPYSVFKDAPVVTAITDKSVRKTVLRQLVGRHKAKTLAVQAADAFIENATAWANEHDRWTAPLPETPNEKNQGFAELARWFVLAQWLARGGKE